eukprot:gene8470-292_t
MKNLLWLLIVALILGYAVSVPVRCGQVDIKPLEEEKEEDEINLDIDTLEEKSLEWINVACKNGDACVFNCGEMIYGCRKKAYFMHFMSKVSGYAKQQVADAYMKACIQRRNDSPYQSFWMKDKIIGLLDVAHRRCHARKLYINSNIAFGDLLNTLINTHEPIYVFLARLAELLLAMEKICLENSRWRPQIKLKINAFFDGNGADLRSLFPGNSYITGSLIHAANEAKRYKDQYKARYGEMRYFLKVKDSLKGAFLDRIGQGNQELCSCRNLFKEGVFRHYFSYANHYAYQECRKIC